MSTTATASPQPPVPSRRRFLRFALAGGGAAALAAAGIVGWAMTRTPTAALVPWEEAGREGTDPRLRALAWGILAPNSHNRQPWQFTLDGADGVLVHADLERLLPVTDPLDRQITVSLGGLCELTRLAAAAEGQNVTITPFPDGEPQPRLDTRPVARLAFTAGPRETSPLFAAAGQRRSNKEPYDTTRPVAPAVLEGIIAAAAPAQTAAFTVEPDARDALRTLTWQAMELELRHPPAMAESAAVMRFGRAEIEASPDGIDMGGPMLEALSLAGLLTRASVQDPSSTAFAEGLAIYETLTHSAMGHLWTISPGNSRAEQLTAGADWLRLNLAATAAGLAVQPFSQALQEYEAMDALYRAVHRRLAPDGGTVQMLARVGYGPQVPPSPRWSLRHKVRAA